MAIASRSAVRVAVADDLDLVVAGVGALLAEFSAVVEVADRLIRGDDVGAPVDVVLLGAYRPAEPALDRVVQLRGMSNVGRVAVYADSWEISLVRAAMRSGADGVLSKSLPPAQLAADLCRIADGQVVIDPGCGLAVRDADGRWAGRGRLTEREAEVLCLVAAGLSNLEAGERLDLAVNTVKTHLRNAYRKVGLKNRAQAAAYVLSRHP